MGVTGKPFLSNASDLRPDAPEPGSEQWKAEREAEEMKGERRQGNGDAELTGESELDKDPDEKKRKLSIDLDPGMNS